MTSTHPKRIAVGIDLGTTNSCVAVVQNSNVEIIINEAGQRITPSCVAFTENERHVGVAAKNQASRNPQNTIYEIKRLIGRKFDDEIVQKAVRNWPFKVINVKGSPNVKVMHMKQEKTFSPEQISAAILTNMKQIAESQLGVKIVDAVITVPAYFNDGQRQATKDAGTIAGLNVLKILSEPTAAAVAYGRFMKIKTQKNVLIFDLGGGTFDVSIVTISDGDFSVQAVGGDTHLGGTDFTNKLVDHFLAVIKRKHGEDLSSKQKALRRLRSSCEDAKCTLSFSMSADLNIEGLFENNDFYETIYREKFEQLCLPLFEKTIEIVEQTLDGAELSWKQISDIILVGGSTRIPKLQEMLKKFFGGRELIKSINPDEAVAYGAAVEAALLSGDNSIKDHTVGDVIPLSLSVEIKGGNVVVGLKQNTKIPISRTINLTTASDYQEAADFKIFEGERSQSKDNHLLGTFRLTNIEYALKGAPNFAVTFVVDRDGILTVSAVDKKTRDSNKIKITANKNRLIQEDIDKMIAEEKAFDGRM